jgi:manganese oxidase
MGLGRISRKRFLAGAVPAIASVPLAGQMLGGHAGMMERKPPEGNPHAHGAEGAIAASEDELHLLVPPVAKAHKPGRVREFEVTADDRKVTLMKDVSFDAWTYNGTVPGPILRVTHDDLLKVTFTNETEHPHSIHFHGTHPPTMDGSLKPVSPGSTFFYEMAARPWGLHLYHCHTQPLASHIAKGLYGALIVDPPKPRPRAQEMVLVMSGFDTDGDGRNDLLAYNGRPFQYEQRPIQVRRKLPVRIYLVNVTEYEPVVSFHLHSAFFKLFRTGTGDSFEYTDTVTLGQGERAIVEIEFEDRGLFMFHAHQSHLADKGLMGWFQVVDEHEPPAAVGFTGGYEDQFGDCAPCLGALGAKPLLKY